MTDDSTTVVPNQHRLHAGFARPHAHPAEGADRDLSKGKLLLGHKNGDITTHYSAAEIGELIAATNQICAAKGTPNITLLRVANG